MYSLLYVLTIDTNLQKLMMCEPEPLFNGSLTKYTNGLNAPL